MTTAPEDYEDHESIFGDDPYDDDPYGGDMFGGDGYDEEAWWDA